MRCFLATVFFLLSLLASGQKISLINSGEVLQEGRTLIDSGKYAQAIEVFLSVPSQDTNYVMIQKELAFAYLSNSEYDKSVAVAEKALSSPSEFRADLLRARAASTARRGDFDAALKLYDAAIREYPTDVDLRYSLAISHYNKKNYDKATEEFFRVLEINPFVSGAHLHLGLMAIRQGRKVHGMFAMGIYIALAPSDNSRLSLLNNFVDNGVTDEGTDTPIGPSASDKLDQIIKAKIAMEDGFKSVMLAKAPVIRQFELLFSQLGMIDPSAKNPWVMYYLPVYQAFQQQKMTEAFIYHILTSSPIETAKKWRSKNDDQLKAFFDVANQEMKKHRERVSTPDFTAPVQAWYFNNNLIEALGNRVSEEVRQGKWIVYYDNAERRAVGDYDARGKKMGVWTYYFNTGKVKSVENYETGEVTVYTGEGTKSEHFYLTNDEIHGLVETYYPQGSIQEKMNFNNGKREGKYEAFFPDGKLWRTYTYRDGKVEGEFKRYHPNGILASREFYKDGLAEGPLVSYLATGKKDSEGAYKEDHVVGDWKYYHPNGRVSRSGRFSDKGFGIGEWVYYDLDGTINERRRFDNEGNLQGENEFFYNGKPHYTITFKKGMRVKVVNYKDDGSVVGTYGNNDGTFACTFFFFTGEKMAEGKFVKGKKMGEWKYYTRYGTLTSHSDYRDDMVQGKLKRYHVSGALKEEAEYVDDEVNGYVITYYPNGKMEQQGWMEGDKRQQRWLYYTAEGVLAQDYYYLNGELRGEASDFAYDGKPFFSAHHDEDKGISGIRQFAENGEVKMVVRPDGWKTSYENRFASGQVRERFSIANGKYYGEFHRSHPDGSVLTTSSYLDDERYGPYVLNYPDGSVSQKGNYVNGKKEGQWRHYHENGKLYSEGAYLDGDRDSVWNYYYDNGQMSQTGAFRYNKLHGVVRHFGPSGVPLVEKQYEDGDMTHFRLVKADGTTGNWIRFTGNEKIEARYADGSPAWLEEFKDGTSHGHSIVYYPGGQVHSDFNYQYDDYEGPCAYYFPNGKVREKGVNHNDEREGLTEMFREDGTIISRENFRLGVRYGKTTLYDEKGKVKKEFTFWHGLVQD